MKPSSSKALRNVIMLLLLWWVDTWRRLQNGLRFSRELEANASLLGNEIANTARE
jgi:hypothetical protein